MENEHYFFVRCLENSNNDCALVSAKLGLVNKFYRLVSEISRRGVF